MLDSNKKIVKENLVTDEKGEIILENMIPGIYYVQETETLAGFNLYTDLTEIGLDLNEEFQVTVNNNTKEVTEVDKEFELVEVTPTYTETVQNVEKVSEVKHVNNVTLATNETVKKLPVTGF